MKEDLYIRKRWRRLQFIAEQFWSRWRKEYLATLQKRQKWITAQRNLTVRDIVLVTDHDTPRSEWPMTIAKAVKIDDDGLVRRVTVELGNKHLDKKGKQLKKASVLERPIQKLILLLEAT